MEIMLREILARLYAPGIGTAPVKNWPAVIRAIRRGSASTDLLSILDQAGLPFEAMLLGAERHAVPEGLRTAIDDPIEALWPLVGRVARGQSVSAVEVSLDAPRLPPAVWIVQDSSEEGLLRTDRPRRLTLAGIGSRAPSAESRRFAWA
ncbi:hypothetical protein EON79_20125, partial [bacterium]